ncbi:MAG TPA: flagellar basal body protein, partial [bacterium]|nr:flagellar basal body protein [bacterium]
MSGFLISASGLTAQRTRMNVIAENLANASTTHPTPYRRKIVLFEERLAEAMDSSQSRSGAGGVRVKSIVEDNGRNAFRYLYDPDHP